MTSSLRHQRVLDFKFSKVQVELSADVECMGLQTTELIKLAIKLFSSVIGYRISL